MTDQPIQDRFKGAMLSIYEHGKKETGYNATRFLQMVQGKGGVQTAKDLLAGDPSAVSAGFTHLALSERLDLSVKALVQKDAWKHLFTAKELYVAKNRLGTRGNK